MFKLCLATAIDTMSEKKSGKSPFYWWLTGLLVSILLMVQQGVASPYVCAAIICAFGAGWYGANAASIDR